jgi:hypothetical protein
MVFTAAVDRIVVKTEETEAFCFDGRTPWTVNGKDQQV